MLMDYCKKDLTPLLTHWSYIFLALTYQCDHGNFHIREGNINSCRGQVALCCPLDSYVDMWCSLHCFMFRIAHTCVHIVQYFSHFGENVIVRLWNSLCDLYINWFLCVTVWILTNMPAVHNHHCFVPLLHRLMSAVVGQKKHDTPWWWFFFSFKEFSVT